MVLNALENTSPNGTDLTKISNNYVKIIEDKLNNTPRKILGYKTPN